MSRAARRHPDRHAPQRDVIIGVVRPDRNVDAHWADWVWNLLWYDRDHGNRIQEKLTAESGPRIARARNDVVVEFLKTDAQWLLWLDADMVGTNDTLERLLDVADKDERPIVGALCFAGGRTITPTIYTFHYFQQEDGTPGVRSDLILSYPEDTIIDVGGTGSACILVHRSVYEAIDEKFHTDSGLTWYQDQIICGRDWGEDLVFCLRAQQVGKRTFIHTGIKMGHRKVFTLEEANFRKFMAAYGDSIPGHVEGETAFTFDDLVELTKARERQS